ncbi:hypothetical protein SprV_0702317900 [Sparganum proliferum]
MRSIDALCEAFCSLVASSFSILGRTQMNYNTSHPSVLGFEQRFHYSLLPVSSWCYFVNYKDQVSNTELWGLTDPLLYSLQRCISKDQLGLS